MISLMMAKHGPKYVRNNVVHIGKFTSILAYTDGVLLITMASFYMLSMSTCQIQGGSNMTGTICV
jgi:hypothetical protein